MTQYAFDQARNALLVILLAAMVLANYRTTILAFAPLAFVQFNLDVIGRFPPRQRAMVGIGILAVSGVAAARWGRCGPRAT